MTRRASTGVQVAVLIALAVLGTGTAMYLLANQSSGLPNPFGGGYQIKAELTSANGVKPSVGAPVDVAGVRVGQIAGLSNTRSGNALVTLEIERDQLPHVYADSTATLEPITPIKDLRISLSPGSPPARPLDDGETIPVARTTPPVELHTLLASLDADTRGFLTSLITSMGEATHGQGVALRRALVALGPTTGQLRLLSKSLAARRDELARLVHNLARVTRAASKDGRMSVALQAGNAALEAVARQEPALRQALVRLPNTLTITGRTLAHVAALSNEVRLTTRALLPGATRLPRTLDRVRMIADAVTPSLSEGIRPFVREARPLVHDVGVAMPDLTALAPRATSILQSVTYLLNVLAYNPPGDDEGGLFWTAWLGHNLASAFGSIGDAHGAILRAAPFDTCSQQKPTAAEITALIKVTMGLYPLCPDNQDPLPE